MAEPERDPRDEVAKPFSEGHETLPVSPRRRRASVTIGCLFLVLTLGLLVWFAVTHTETTGRRGFLGWSDPGSGVGAPPGEPARRL